MRPTIYVCLEIAAVLAAAPVCLGCAGRTAAEPAPALAFAATATDIAPGGCAIGSPRVLAQKAAPPAGVSARAESQAAWIAFGPTAVERVALKVDPVSLGVVETITDGDAAPTSIAHGDGVFAWLDGGRSIRAWTEGSTESGHRVRVQTLDRTGEPLDAPVALQGEGSAVGAPAVAVDPSGRGVVAFIESNGHGFQLVAAPLDCSIHSGGDVDRLAQR
jgi:hypothetical protein